MSDVFQESYMVPLACGAQLALRRIFCKPRMPPVFLVHSLFERSSNMGIKPGGLIYSLVQEGFDVWLPDLRGHGRSWPPVNESYKNTKMMAIDDWVSSDLPRLLAHAEEKCGQPIQLLGGHGYGAQLMLQSLMESGRLPDVKGLLFLASSRTFDLAKAGELPEPREKISALKQLSANVLQTKMAVQKFHKGYFSGRNLALGNSLEYIPAWQKALLWAENKNALSQIEKMPDSLYIAIEGARLWGAPSAVSQMMQEFPPHDGCQVTLTRAALTAKKTLFSPSKGKRSWLNGVNDDVAKMIATWLAQRS